MAAVRLALCQINATVGDIRGNIALMESYLAKAREAGADIAAFPEMAVTGYPPEDLLLKPDFLAKAMAAAEELVAASRGLTLVFGCPRLKRDLQNAAFVAHNGELAAVYAKRFLPNYGVFDENRYFAPGTVNRVFDRHGFAFGVSVCEDIWYPGGPPDVQALEGDAALLINISASPYHLGKGADRECMLSVRAADTTTFVAYVNLVGGQDELVFDGHSLVVDPKGDILARGRQFDEDLVLVDLDPGQLARARLLDPRRRKWRPSAPAPIERTTLPGVAGLARPPLGLAALPPVMSPVEEVYAALVRGTGDYVRKSGFKEVVIGLSGGIDSSLTAAIAVDALGADRVFGVAMPTRYSSEGSVTDARALAENLGVAFTVAPIEPIFTAFLDTLAPAFAGSKPDVTEENLQPRIRGTLLMALSNKFGRLVLTTGNKSETGVGYSTLYGDTAGGFAVIKDVPKTLVYDLCRWRNAKAGRDLIPWAVLDKPPSAELRPDQKDIDSLPAYEVLDPILEAYVQEGLAPEGIKARGFEAAVVDKVVRLVDRNEYKRRQSPPGVKITPRAFGKDWRLPIVNRYTGR